MVEIHFEMNNRVFKLLSCRFENWNWESLLRKKGWMDGCWRADSTKVSISLSCGTSEEWAVKRKEVNWSCNAWWVRDGSSRHQILWRIEVAMDWQEESNLLEQFFKRSWRKERRVAICNGERERR